MKKIGLDKLINVSFIVLVVAMLIVWKPWSMGEYPLTVTGEGKSTIESEPDTFTFMPSYSVTSKDSKEIYDKLSVKSTDVVKVLKSAGVEEKNISIDASSYDYWRNYVNSEGIDQTGNAIVTVKASDKAMAEKIQSVLSSTGATGLLTPIESFSEAKTADLKKQARKEAIANAKNDAQEKAQELGKKLGEIFTIDDSNYGAYPMPYYNETTGKAIDASYSASSASIPLLPGQNEYNYTIRVIYELK